MSKIYSISEASRLPPQAIEAEQSVLGATLIERGAVPAAFSILSPDEFYDSRHAKIYRAIHALFEKGSPVDLITLTEELKGQGELKAIGGAHYLAELTTAVPSAANVEYHARIVAERAVLRRIIEVCASISQQAYDPGADAFEVLGELESHVLKVGDRFAGGNVQPMSVFAQQALEAASIVQYGTQTGIEDYDALTGGFYEGNLVVIAGRPSMGKSSVAMTMARNISVSEMRWPQPGAIISLEMTGRQLAHRIICSIAKIDSHMSRVQALKGSLLERYRKASKMLGASPLYVIEPAGLTITKISAQLRRLKMLHDIKYVIIDYLQLIQLSGGQKSTSEQIGEITRSLKLLALELGICVVLLSQLNRAVETRGGDKRPMLSDLRNSGDIEQDSDVVAFVYRPEKYGIMVYPDYGNMSTEGVGEIIVEKNRDGPTGTAWTTFVERFSSFENPAYERPFQYRPPQPEPEVAY